jgi:hypothetical protein
MQHDWTSLAKADIDRTDPISESLPGIVRRRRA